MDDFIYTNIMQLHYICICFKHYNNVSTSHKRLRLIVGVHSFCTGLREWDLNLITNLKKNRILLI